ncbi:MAG: nitrilase [Helicobacteraceae bacterium]|nr:nitrilase [Helicobacteraceae bacterium]
MNVTLAQIAPKLNRSNLEDHLKVIKESTADVVVFPELSLNGYMLQDRTSTDAWTEDELDSLCEASIDVDIVVGLAFREVEKVYNSAIYISKGKIVHIHKKNHLPTYGMFEEARYFTKGNLVEAFNTSYGKTFIVVCEDVWDDEFIDKLVAQNPNLIYVLAASPARGFCDGSLEIEDQWQNILAKKAKATKAKVIFVNRVGFEDGLGFWGGSRVLDENGKILHKLNNFDRIIKDVNISSLRG